MSSDAHILGQSATDRIEDGRPSTTPIPWVNDDGGRAAAGFKGSTGDCVVRAIAIAAELPYLEVYQLLRHDTLNSRPVMARLELRYGPQARRHASPRNGVDPKIYKPYLEELGFTWVPTMEIGSGCTTHLRQGELPDGRLIVRLSKHLAAVIDGELHDTHDCGRGGTRCVYGYWKRS